MPEIQPRPLSAEEQQTLEYLLGAPVAAMEELNRQVPGLLVVGRCHCGCATIDLQPDRSRVSAASQGFGIYPVVVHAFSKESAAAHPAELMLFVRDGWLDSLEIVDYLPDRTLDVFPPVDTWEAPIGSDFTTG